jgi:hypothetical protein
MHDKSTGGCRDGLHIDRLNENQGAESTLSLIQAILEMQQFAREHQDQVRVNGKRRAAILLVSASKING